MKKVTITKSIAEFEEFWGEYSSRELDTKLRQYLVEAFEHGCYTYYEEYSVLSVRSETDSNGEHLVFSQSLYRDPRENTFVSIDGGNQVNRCEQCDGIDIWDTDALVKASRVCDECGKPVERFSDLHWHLYAGLACDDCIDGIREYEDSKPSGYWTC